MLKQHSFAISNDVITHPSGSKIKCLGSSQQNVSLQLQSHYPESEIFKLILGKAESLWPRNDYSTN